MQISAALQGFNSFFNQRGGEREGRFKVQTEEASESRNRRAIDSAAASLLARGYQLTFASVHCQAKN